jgi:hypothetical protein
MARSSSGLDLLVIGPDFARHGDEYGRLQRGCEGLGWRSTWSSTAAAYSEEWSGAPGSFLHQALAEGRILGGA